MPDPRLQLTRQDLLYAATAMRREARWSLTQAANPQYGSTRAVFGDAAHAKEELAQKIQRIAEQLATD